MLTFQVCIRTKPYFNFAVLFRIVPTNQLYYILQRLSSKMRSKFQILQKSFLGPTNSSNPLLQTCIIQNNTALKQAVTNGAAAPSFGTIRNNTALKLMPL